MRAALALSLAGNLLLGLLLLSPFDRNAARPANAATPAPPPAIPPIQDTAVVPPAP